MKLLELNILNLASIAEARIDFESAELTDSPVFLITGETGAGKSTILDAICLALYNKVPRMVSVNTKKGDDSYESEEERSNTPYQLLRKGTGETLVTLRFTGLDGAEYEAHWGIYRARKNPAGALQDNKMDLTMRRLERDADGKVVKETEIKRSRRNAEEVTESLIGLTYNQFCRTTMLAQGEFTTFLKSDGQEKSNILAKVTDRSDFAEISREIHTIAGEKKEVCDTLRTRMESLRLLDEDELAALRESLREKDGTLSRLQLEEKSVDKKLKWLETAAALEARTQKYTKELDELRGSAPGLYRRMTILADKLRADKEKTEAEYTRDRSALEALSDKRAVIENADAVRTLLDDIISARRESARLVESVSAREKEISRHLEKLERLGKIVSGCEESLETVRKERDRLRAELDAKNLGQLAEEIAALTSHKTVVGKLSADIRTHLDAETDLKTLEEEYESECKSHKDNERKRDGLATELEKCRKEVDAADTKAREIELTVSETADELRRMLAPGCRCPVCRGIVETVAAFDAVEENGRLKAARADAAKKRDDFDARNAEISELNGVLAVEQKNIGAKKKKIEAERQRLSVARKKLEEAIREEDETLDISDGSIAGLKKRETEIDREIAARTRIAEEARPLTAALKKEEKRCSDAETELKNSQNDYNTEKLAIGSLQSVTESENARIAEYGAAVDESFRTLTATEGVGAFPYVRPDQSERFRILLSGYVALKERLETRLERNAGILTELGRSMDSLSVSSAALKEKIPGQDYTPEEDMADVREDPEKLCRDSDTLLSGIGWHEQELSRIADDKEAHYKERPEYGEDDTPETLSEEQVRLRESQTAVSTERGALLQQIETDADNRRRVGTLKTEYDAAMSEYSDWAAFDRQLGSATGDKFNRIAQSYILADLLKRANVYLGQLSDRYRLSGDPGTYRINIIDLRQGGASRSAHTSSGGESFLISLALALALGDMGPGLSVDPLFIDEGFGTLSDEPLQRAIALLGTLREKIGRRVGLISHVKALRDAVPVQLRLSTDPRSGATAISTVM